MVRPPLDPATEMAAWFVCGLARPQLRRISRTLLRCGAPGDFIVRDVASRPEAFGLLVKGDAGLISFMVVRTATGGVALDGSKSEFRTIAELIRHYGAKRRSDLGVRPRSPPARQGGGALCRRASTGRCGF